MSKSKLGQKRQSGQLDASATAVNSDVAIGRLGGALGELVVAHGVRLVLEGDGGDCGGDGEEDGVAAAEEGR